MPSLDSIRRSVFQAASETVTASDFMVVIRTFGVLTVVMGCLAAYMWVQMEVTRISVALDETRSDLARAETIHERLLLEKSMMLQPGRLQDEANVRGMVAPQSIRRIQSHGQNSQPGQVLAGSTGTGSTGSSQKSQAMPR